MNEDNDLLFSDTEEDELPVSAELTGRKPWKILIIDDEPEVHQITKLALVNFSFENRRLEFLHAYSAEEAAPIISANPDIALILLDVVMETNHAGLDLIEKIREEVKNTSVRIILRTGQPGLAPERNIIVQYDINDYVEKAEFSAQKLFTVIVASLRAYRDILKLEDSRAELLLANQRLAEQSERIQVTLDSIGDGVLTTDANGEITHLNPIAQTMTGWNLQAAIGKDVREIFPIVDASTRETIENPIDKVILTGETVYLRNHTTLISKSGDEYQIADSAAPIRDAKAKILGMVLVFNDVTEQYALREKAKRSRRNLQMIMDNTPAVIYAKDLSGRYIFINQKFETLFNIKNADIIGNTDFDIFPINIAQKFKENDQKTLQLGKPFESEEEAPIGEKLHHYLSVKFPLFNDDGKGDEIYGICSISTDITDRKAQEEQLRRSQKMDAIGQLTGGIAHDFNNQLSVIMGYLDLLVDFTSHDAKTTKWIEAATKSALRCADLTRQLLSFSRTKSNDKSTVNVNELLAEYKTMFSRSVTPAIEVQYCLAKELWLTEINSAEFQDAALNLVINARDAMSGNGTLLIETSNIYIDEDYIALNPGSQMGNHVQFILSDTGTGMDKTTQEKIFDPFYTTKESGKGTGLGMSMVYGFVKRFNGFIKIYSELGIGTTIRLYFPQANEAASTTSHQENKEINLLPPGNETILIVDDEVQLLHLAQKSLTALGYKTYTAENAQQALEIYSSHTDIDCLFSDVVMPGGINGYELAERLTQKNPRLKVLLSSGFTSQTLAKNGQSRFAQNLLDKPYRTIDLANRIRMILDQN